MFRLFILFIICLQGLVAAVPKVYIQELENGWTLQNQNKSITIRNLKIPSGVYTALKGENYGDILHSNNDKSLRWVAYDNWTYTAQFEISQDNLEYTRRINLTLHGIDTIATVRLNGQIIGHTSNMFVRYSFDMRIDNRIKQNNILEIEFQSPILTAKQIADEEAERNVHHPPKCPPEIVNGVCYRNMLRKMQASFGTDANLAALSMGIWKPVTLDFYDIAIMRDVDIVAYKNETHWTMDIRVFLSTGIKMNFYGNLTLLAPDFDEHPISFGTRLIKYASLVENYVYEIPINNVKPWWPNGYGEQKLYPFVFRMKLFEEKENARFRSGWVTQKFLTFGFRTLELVEDKDEIGRTFYFKVNDQPIFTKGAIYLPSHILPEEESHITSSSLSRMKHLLISAKKANFNMIRIWGGGVYGSDILYNMADIYGLLVWQDLPFTGATYPVDDPFVESVRLEVAQNAKRIGYHPSLALIVTNDEIEMYLVKNRTDFGTEAESLEQEYQQLFPGTIKHELSIISRNQYKSRPGPMLSTPSLGCEETKNSLPADPQDQNYGDVHFWPDEKDDAWNPNIYPAARFISEYGFQSLPVRISWNRTLEDGDNIIGLMRHRQHNEKGFDALVEVIKRHLPDFDWIEDSDTFIYFSQVSQALAVKTATEVFLSNRVNYRTMGAVFWHLNDVWIAPTWSSIDFYGNYKLLYYWSKRFLAPLNIIALKDEKSNAINVTLIREGLLRRSKDGEIIEPKTMTVTVNIYLWSKLYPQKTSVREEYVGDNTLKKFQLPLKYILKDQFNENNCFVEVVLSHQGRIHASDIFLPGKIKDAIGVQDPQLNLDIAHLPQKSSSSNNVYVISYSLTIRIDYPALFVFIEVFHPEIRKFELSENGFIQMEPIRVIHLSFEHDEPELERKLTNEHFNITTMNQFLVQKNGFKPETTMTSASTTEE